MPHQVRPGNEIDGFLVGEQIHSGAMSNIFEITRPGQIAHSDAARVTPSVGSLRPTRGAFMIAPLPRAPTAPGARGCDG